MELFVLPMTESLVQKSLGRRSAKEDPPRKNYAPKPGPWKRQNDPIIRAPGPGYYNHQPCQVVHLNYIQ